MRSLLELLRDLAQEYESNAVHDQRYHGDNDEGDGNDLPYLSTVARYIDVHLEATDDLTVVVIDGHVGLDDVYIELVLICQILDPVFSD